LSGGQPMSPVTLRRAGLATARHFLGPALRAFSASVAIVALALTLPACGKGMSDPLPHPPSGPFDPGAGGTGGYGSGSGGGGAGVPDGPPMCDPTLRRCAHEFSYGPMTLTGHEKTVTMIGDWRTDSWTNGDAATFDGAKWVVSVPAPWAAPVTYKF